MEQWKEYEQKKCNMRKFLLKCLSDRPSDLQNPQGLGKRTSTKKPHGNNLQDKINSPTRITYINFVLFYQL